MTKSKWTTLLIIASILLLGFITIVVVLARNNFAPLAVDKSVAQWAYDCRGEKGGFTYYFFRIFTEFGHFYFVILLLILLAIIWRFKSKFWFFAGIIASSTITQVIIKAIVMRPRPEQALQWMSESSSSFPSGHSMTVACVFILLTYFIITSPTAKIWLKYLIITLSTFAISLVPISRIILGVHYFTDVIGGLLLGSFFAILGILAYEFYQYKFAKYTNSKICST